MAVIFLLPVLLFGLVGINVANSYHHYHACLWIPLLLTILSAGVIISMVFRLIRRYLF
jgi:Mg2+ and Co2+ transporter CorA